MMGILYGMKLNWENQKGQTDIESYNNQKILYLKDNDLFLEPEEWKRMRVLQLKKEGKIWSG